MNFLQRCLKIDSFLLILIAVVLTATFFPCKGSWKTFFEYLTNFAIGLLFFMHGAKLSFNAIMNGIRNWKLHILIFSITFIVFPLLGLCLQVFVPTLLSEDLYLGFLYLCTLPATVQSAIAFTSIARGNVAAAVCSASASTLLGVFITPILVGILMHTQAAGSIDLIDTITSIMLKLMLPFAVGHLSRRFIGKWVDSHRKIIGKTDQTSILLVVYVAFSDAVVNGIWQLVNGFSFAVISILSTIMLFIVLMISTFSARLLGFSKEDEITIVFCGSKKSLASGVPIASVIFPVSVMGIMVLPLMIFHQIQLMICAVLARKYAQRFNAEK